MSRHDIRFRKEPFHARNTARHKNYDFILERHKKSNRLRMYSQLLLVILIVSILIGITYLSGLHEKAEGVKNTPQTQHQLHDQ